MKDGILNDRDINYLNEAGIYEYRVLPNGEIIGLHDFIFSVGLVSDIKLHAMAYYYHHRYCYPKSDRGLARDALAVWDGKSKPLAGYIAYKGMDKELFDADEERKRNNIAMEDQNII